MLEAAICAPIHVTSRPIDTYAGPAVAAASAAHKKQGIAPTLDAPAKLLRPTTIMLDVVHTTHGQCLVHVQQDLKQAPTGELCSIPNDVSPKLFPTALGSC